MLVDRIARPLAHHPTQVPAIRNVSGRNQLVGTIAEIKISGLLAHVVLKIGDQQITSIITSDAAREMQLRKGQTAGALIISTGGDRPCLTLTSHAA